MEIFRKTEIKDNIIEKLTFLIRQSDENFFLLYISFKKLPVNNYPGTPGCYRDLQHKLMTKIIHEYL